MRPDRRLGQIFDRQRPGNVMEDAFKNGPAGRTVDVFGEPEHQPPRRPRDVVRIKRAGRHSRSVQLAQRVLEAVGLPQVIEATEDRKPPLRLKQAAERMTGRTAEQMTGRIPGRVVVAFGLVVFNCRDGHVSCPSVSQEDNASSVTPSPLMMDSNQSAVLRNSATASPAAPFRSGVISTLSQTSR